MQNPTNTHKERRVSKADQLCLCLSSCQLDQGMKLKSRSLLHSALLRLAYFKANQESVMFSQKGKPKENMLRNCLKVVNKDKPAIQRTVKPNV